MTFFRYPGGKRKIKDRILQAINRQVNSFDFEYREPFFGGGSIGVSVLDENPYLRKIWINDKDIALSCLWTAVVRYPDALIAKIKGHCISVEDFDRCKNVLKTVEVFPDSPEDIIQAGFYKLLIHQISYSGLGMKSGGPLGGKDQTSDYKIDCRWSPGFLAKKIVKLHQRFSRCQLRHGKCTDLDFSHLIEDKDGDYVMYLDPPYYMKGNDLYECGFTQEDHYRLARSLAKACQPWVLSYDSCPEVKELYAWACIEEVQIQYSINGSVQKTELIVTPK